MAEPGGLQESATHQGAGGIRADRQGARHPGTIAGERAVPFESSRGDWRGSHARVHADPAGTCDCDGPCRRTDFLVVLLRVGYHPPNP